MSEKQQQHDGQCEHVGAGLFSGMHDGKITAKRCTHKAVRRFKVNPPSEANDGYRWLCRIDAGFMPGYGEGEPLPEKEETP